MDSILSARVGALTSRLDECFGLIAAAQAQRQRPVLEELKSQGLSYAQSLAAVRSSQPFRDVHRTLALIERFCELIETELPDHSNVVQPENV
ncbi:hypothetical protein [Cupriavidus pinatubonensis]|uniref:Uncharacterized protein n=1 Tax=Cupriavidus pinatubonensis TaxID=248026 RepID=A0ABN7Y8N2_9BURK|nr:hypothetical protein [Cupriavidus pinatubonensis]CAG9169749.1 hypothetical protein LMG23994_01644 [Cupriavidus pinatubonensis]